MTEQYEYITEQSALESFCSRMASSPVVAFDTEFVSEDAYEPELCLLQVACGKRFAIIDPLALDDVQPFWDAITGAGHVTVVHAGHQEFQFCLAATGKRPENWFDVQIAAGFVGLEYPAAYRTLIAKLLGKKIAKGETRTNWRRRPLTKRQLQYALQDVTFLEPLYREVSRRIDELGRAHWLEEELHLWQKKWEGVGRSEPWRRISGAARLQRRQLAIVRELWQWRDAVARQRNCPARRVLRDDLILELAKRQSPDVQRIRMVRGLEHRHLKRSLGDVAACVERALQLPENECPEQAPPLRSQNSELQLLGQFLGVVLSSLCREAQIAPSLVGTTQDLRDLVVHRLGMGPPGDEPPSLACGWRAEVVGRVIDDFLAGKLAVRIGDVRAENPLQFEQTDGLHGRPE